MSEPVKTHATAVVLIPPQEVWEPIQAIRRRHDRKVRRWMPHITLLYPFRPRSEFQQVEGLLTTACSRIEPFQVTLGRFRFFRHGKASFTLWLEPQPRESLEQIERRLVGAMPDCDDQSCRAEGFTPHLSIGQVRGKRARQRTLELQNELEETWKPVSFTAREVSMIWRNDPPDDIFRVDRTVPLGAPL